VALVSLLDERSALAGAANEVTVYRLYGHYSFNARDGGLPMTLSLADGYEVGAWVNHATIIIGPRVAMSIELAIHHGFARIVA